MQPQFGLEWAKALEKDLDRNLDRMSAVEIIPENFFDGANREFLQRLARDGKPVAVHGVGLSIGTYEPLNTRHFDRQLAVAAEVNAVNFSEHVAMTRVRNVDLDVLTPLDWSVRLADHICRKIDKIQSRLGIPFLVENVSNRFQLPGTELTETQFLSRILERTGCGLLLDVTNVYTNSVNFGFDPYRWVDEMDLSRTRLVHLAGGRRAPDGFLNDSHDSKVPAAAWRLYEYVCRKVVPEMTIVERTDNYPHFSALKAELERAAVIVADARKGERHERSATATGNRAGLENPPRAARLARA